MTLLMLRETPENVLCEEMVKMYKVLMRNTFFRQRMAERDDNLAEAYEEENKERANRIANKTIRQAEILRSEQARTEKVENLRNARVEFRRERQEKYFEIEEQNEAAKEARVTKRQVRSSEVVLYIIGSLTCCRYCKYLSTLWWN